MTPYDDQPEKSQLPASSGDPPPHEDTPIEILIIKVVERLDSTVQKLEEVVVHSKVAAEQAAKARTGNRLVGACVAISILVAIGGVWLATDSRHTASEVDTFLHRYLNDQQTIREATCRSRNSAQEAARRDAAARVQVALDSFANGVASVVPSYTEELNQIKDTAIAQANAASTPFYDVDNDCDFDSYFTLTDYDSVAPNFDGGPVPFPTYRTPISTPSTTTPPNGG